MKKITTIFLDAELLSLWKKQHRNLSEAVNRFLHASLIIDSHDLATEKTELDRDLRLQEEVAVRIQGRKDRITVLEEANLQREQEEAHKAAEAAKDELRCALCGKVFSSLTDLKTFPVGKVCRDCRLSSDTVTLMSGRNFIER